MKDDLSSLDKLLQETRNLVSFHQHCELDYPLSAQLKSFLKPASLKTTPQPFSPAQATAKPAAEKSTGQHRADALTLDELRSTLESCEHCPLGKSRHQMIFGEGSVRQGIALFIICDPPGPEEEAANRPISGAPRELLVKMLRAINLSLDDIFLTNIVKCAPPAERIPTTAETSACLPFLMLQIELIKPKIIFTLGQIASQTMLKNSQSLVSLRGRFHDFHGIPLMPTFHPARLLKVQELKKAAWHDLQMIQKKLKTLT